MVRLYLVIIVFISSVMALSGQVDVAEALKARYSFDQCDARDDSGNNSTGMVEGAQCQCGVLGESLFFDGSDDRIQFEGNINEYFKANNFTISFYFKPSSSSPNTVLLSKYESCGDETGLIMRYGNGSVAVSLKGSTGIENNLNVKLNGAGCWIHIALVRRGSAIELYQDGMLIGEQDNGVRNTDITNSSSLTLAMGQCMTSLDQPFRGNIDELAIYNQPLSDLQIRKLLLPVDQVVTQDTVVAMGDSFVPRISKTCAADIQWAPSQAVTPSIGASPVVAVTQSTTLIASFNYGNCVTSDSIRVRVVDSEDIECENIPMPRAFTPNGDGLNDEYFIALPGAFDELVSFQIFNKWNQLIFETENPAQVWDGSFEGQKLNPGGFLYKIRYKCMGTEYVKTGEFLLMN